jgi:hypothetical protein
MNAKPIGFWELNNFALNSPFTWESVFKHILILFNLTDTCQNLKTPLVTIIGTPLIDSTIIYIDDIVYILPKCCFV